ATWPGATCTCPCRTASPGARWSCCTRRTRRRRPGTGGTTRSSWAWPGCAAWSAAPAMPRRSTARKRCCAWTRPRAEARGRQLRGRAVLEPGGQRGVIPSSVAPPGDDSWVIAVHASPDDWTPLGTGVLVDPHRVLTCAHVLKDRTVADGLWVAFGK